MKGTAIRTIRYESGTILRIAGEIYTGEYRVVGRNYKGEYQVGAENGVLVYQVGGGAYTGEYPEDGRNCISEHQEGGGTILGLITLVERSTLGVLSRWWDCKG